MSARKNLIGKIFGKLTVSKYSHTNKDNRAIWKCICECGNTITVSTNSLSRKQTMSCGCLRSEKTSQRNRESSLIIKKAKTNRIPKSGKSLGDKYPQTLLDWHPTKNGTLTPFDVNPGCNDKIWWLGRCGHEWQTTINKRTRQKNPTGCPYCSGKSVLKGFNDIQTTCPNLCEEWHLNNVIKPTEVTQYSHKKIFWKCIKCYKIWQAHISDRTSKNSGCPHCNESKGEKEVVRILNKYNIKHEREKTFINLISAKKHLLRFDFYLQEYNICIEYQGEQHYGNHVGFFKESAENTQQHDNIKRQYCIDNNITLIEIPYWNYNKIEQIICEELRIKTKEIEL